MLLFTLEKIRLYYKMMPLFKSFIIYFVAAMKGFPLSILFLSTLFATISFTNSQLTGRHYVIPSDGSQDCPPGEECHQLSYYAGKPSMLLPNMLLFSNGEHLLEKEITFSAFNALFLIGLKSEWSEGPHKSTMQSSVIIRCTNDSIIAFSITYTQSLALIGLTVTGCKTAFSLHNVWSLHINKSSVQNSTSSGLNWQFDAENVTSIKVHIIKSSFYQNCLNPLIHNSSDIECCHLSLIMITRPINSTSYYVTHSNFSYGSNLYAGVKMMTTPSKQNAHKSIKGLQLNVLFAHCLFLHNSETECGGLLLKLSSFINGTVIVSYSKFLHNSVVTERENFAGGMTILLAMKTGFVIIFDSLFQKNQGGGGLIEVLYSGIVAITNSTFNENLCYWSRSACYGAGLRIITYHFYNHVSLTNTSITYNKNKSQQPEYGALYIVCFSIYITNWLENVTISHNTMTGIYTKNCQLSVTGGTSIISNNTSNFSGGGLNLESRSLIYSVNSGRIIFNNNSAKLFGGAIVSNEYPFPIARVHDISNEVGCTLTGLDAVFINNHADLAGDDIYGGQFVGCLVSSTIHFYNNKHYYSCVNTSCPVFSHIDKPLSSVVSSSGIRVCLCSDDGIVNCATWSINRTVYPGSIITLSLVTIGMCGGVTPGVLQTETHNINVTLGSSDQRTRAKFCKNFSYMLRQVDLNIQKGYLIIRIFDQKYTELLVGIQFLNCPPGLRLSSTGACDCNPVISSIDNAKCNVSWENAPLRRTGNVWLSYKTQLNCTIANDDCPFDYCNSSTVYLSLDDPDAQCNFNRSGILCGGCQTGLSLMLGSNKCEHCNDKYLSLLIAFIFTGIVLLAFLLFCNLTVSVGSINGLLFYANIVKLNEVILFPNGVRVPVLSQFIAWFNLDLGIETCFFNGLDGYWKTWLQFVFPIYIWLLIGAIIIGSYYSGRLSRVFGNNTVPVLATLILMSYSKLLRTITNALMISKIKCDEEEWSVWSIDANIDYLDFKHSFLFGGSVLFLLVGLLYGGMVFSAQWLQKCTGRYCKSSRDPLVKLKPLVDSYTGPYKDKYRFWTGLLIFIRVLLTALFSYTTQTMPGINNYIIAIVCVLLIRAAAAGVYRETALNYLEFFHYFNLFSISLLSELSFRLQWNTARVYLSSASVITSMIVFTGTVLDHIFLKMNKKYRIMTRFKLASNEENDNLLQNEEMQSVEEREGSPPRIIQRRESMIFNVSIET